MLDFKKLNIKWTPYIPHEPTPKQLAFLMLRQREALFGGAAGGGKSDALLMSALQWVDVPGYNALIFRKTLTDLKQPGALLQRAHEWLDGTNAKYVPSEHKFIFPTFDDEGNPAPPATLNFGYIGDAQQFLRYQGIEIQGVFWDEVTQHCVHPDTEVLTDKGWKQITEVSVGDKVMSLNEDYSCGYQKVKKVHEYDYSGYLHSTKHPGLSYAVTPNHRMMVEYQTRREWRFCLAEDLPEIPRYPTTQVWSGVSPDRKNFKLPRGQGHGVNSNSVTSVCWDDWCEFLGWYLSEGSCWCRQNNRSSCVSIRQTKEAPTLDALMERLPWKAVKTPGEGWKIYSKQLVDVLLPLGNTYQKRVPRDILDCGVPSLKIFLDAFLLGDGSSKGAFWSVSLNNEGLIDDLQEVCVKIGRSSSKKGWCQNNNGPNDRDGVTWACRLHVHDPGKKKRIDTRRNQYKFLYKGKVNCLTVANTGNFLMRYNGNVMWTGNSEEHYRYLFSRLRKLACPIHKTDSKGRPVYVPECGICRRQAFLPLICRSATNPGGPGAAWVKRRFRIEPHISNKEAARTGEKQRFIGKHSKRPFIPSFAKDNPFLNLEAYGHMLDELDPITREQLAEGRWDVTADSQFKRHWARYYSVRGEYIILGEEGRGQPYHRDTLKIFAVVDPATTTKHGPGDTNTWMKQPSFTVISIFGLTDDYNLIWLDMIRFRRQAPEVIKALLRVNKIWRPQYFVMESNGVGNAIVQQATREGLTVKPLFQRRDKLDNAAEAMIRMERGLIWFPENASWLQVVEDEVFYWTGDPRTTDDIVDTMSNAARDVTWEDAQVWKRGIDNDGEVSYTDLPDTVPYMGGGPVLDPAIFATY